MPDENNGLDAQALPTPPTASGTQATGSGEQGKIEDLPTWAQTLVRELRDEAASRRTALKKQEEEAARATQTRLAEEGKWKELAETRAADAAKLQPYQQRAADLERVLTDSNNRRIVLIPEGMRTLVPQLPAEQVAAWLDANWGLLTRKAAPDIDAGAGAGNGNSAASLTSEQLAMAARMGLTPEQYAKAK